MLYSCTHMATVAVKGFNHSYLNVAELERLSPTCYQFSFSISNWLTLEQGGPKRT